MPQNEISLCGFTRLSTWVACRHLCVDVTLVSRSEESKLNILL